MATSDEFLKEEDENLLATLTNQMLSLEKEDQTNVQTMDSLALAEDRSPFEPDFTWTISGMREKLKECTFEIKSEVFEWSGYPGVRSRAKLEVKPDGKAYIGKCLEEPHRDIKLIPAVYYVLRDRTGSCKHKSRVSNYPFDIKFDPSLTFDVRLVLRCALNDPTYNVEDSVAIDVYVEPPEVAHRVHSRDGTLIGTIDNFRRRKEMAKEGLVWFVESPYLYTGPKGYRVQVRLWLHGYKGLRGKTLLAQIKFLAGEFDDDLPLTFPHRTTLTLCHPKDPSRSITKIKEQDIPPKKTYFIGMGSNEEIEKVLDDDTITFKVTITPS